MDDIEAQKYREAADLVWELSKQFHGYEVAEDLKSISTELHSQAAGRKSMFPTSE